jgi:ArsR family transcriptional regulator
VNAKEVQAFFERVATEWDTMRLAYYDERVIEKMAAVCGVDRTMTVADVGTGTGFVAAGLAPHVGQVVAVDNSQAMLDVAKDNLDALGARNVDLIEGNIMALPLRDASADAAVANMVLHHAEDTAAMLREMARVVRPSGAVVIVDEVEHSREWMREEHADIWLGFRQDEFEGFFGAAGLVSFGYEALGMQ